MAFMESNSLPAPQNQRPGLENTPFLAREEGPEGVLVTDPSALP